MLRTPSILAPRPRRAVILLVVLALLTLFAIVGLSFVLYSNSQAEAARNFRDSQTEHRADLEPELLFSYFLSQFVYDVPDEGPSLYSGLRGHSLSRSLFGLNYDLRADGSLALGTNAVPFNGTGRLTPPYPPSPLPGWDDYYLINYTYFANDGFLRDPERYGSRLGPRPVGAADNRQRFVGGFNAPYTYPDLNNMFLAAIKAGPTTLADGTPAPAGLVLMPSFHRPWLFGRLTDIPGMPTGNPGNLNWTKPEGKYLLLRPRPIDMGPGFPYPEDEGGDVQNRLGGPGYYDPWTGRVCQNDSVWLDLNFPVMTAPDGRKFKPLFAPLILDLDNRVNLNVAGNLRGLNGAHASNSGWGPWEVNPGQLSGDPRLMAEWQNLLKGGQGQAGRYGTDTHPHSVVPGNALPFAPARFYAPVDLDGSNEWSGGAPSDSLHLPGLLPSLPYQCFPTRPGGYGNGSPLERVNHPGLYNPFQPTPPDRRFALSNMEALLRYGDTGSSALTSELYRLCPGNFGNPATGVQRRGQVTLSSFDPDRPGVTPWFWVHDQTSGAEYQRWPPLASLAPPPVYPAAGPVGTPNWTALPLYPDSEFSPDGRADATVTALGRLDLNRPLPDYPNPDASGLITDHRGFVAAQLARQSLAAQIFERLWRLTGAGNPALMGPPGVVVVPAGMAPFDQKRWDAFRFLAQLAVNIVDFIDNDDYMTPFNWYPPHGRNLAGEWVFGTELPRVVLNEAYVEYVNDHSQPGHYKANMWLELVNTFQHDPPATAPYRDGTALLDGVYRVKIARVSGDLRQSADWLGDVPAPRRNVISRFSPREILPADSANPYSGTRGGNQGFYVLGPNVGPAENPFAPPMETLSLPEMSWSVRAVDPAIYGLPQPSFLLQRLACPYLQPNPNPRDLLRPYNPYVTVDYMQHVPCNYAIASSVNGIPPFFTPVADRFSVGRLQPYAAREQRAQQPNPRNVGQPKHTFFQHNADAQTPVPNSPYPPLGYPHFDWLVHLDRHLISPMELLHVSAYKPYELTHQFMYPSTRIPTFNHRAPWFDEDLDPSSYQSHRLYRVLEFLEASPPSATPPSERIAGKINLNTVWDEETFLALCDPQPSNSFSLADARTAFRLLKASRTVPIIPPDPKDPPFQGETPGRKDRPLRSLATGPTASSSTALSGGIGDTLLRPAVAGGQPLLAVTGKTHPYQTYELMTKIFNQVTVRSNVFAVWITVGFFEVTDDTTRPVKLGAEVGRSEGRNVRHRMFAIVDRSQLLAHPGPQPDFDPRAAISPGSASGTVVPHWSIID